MRQTVWLALLAAGSMGLAFLNQWFVFVHFGPGIETDALFAGMTIPSFIVVLTSGPLGNTLVPLLSTELEGESGRRDAWSLFWAVGAVFLVVTAVLLVSAFVWVPVLLPGFDDAARRLTLELSAIQLLGIVFTAQYSVVWAVAQAKKQFIRTELTLFVSLIVAFGAMVLAAPRFGAAGVAWLSVIRPALQILALLGCMGAPMAPDFKTAVLGEAWRRLKPLLFGSVYYKSEIIVDRYLSSMAPAGGLSLFHLTKQLYASACGVLSKAIAGPVVPSLAQLAKAGRYLEFRSLARKNTLLLGTITSASYLGLLLVGRPFLALLIGHGGVTAENLETLYALMIAMGGALIGAMGQVLASAFYALGDTTTPTKASILGFTLGVGFKIGGFMFGGLTGLAIGTSLYFAVNLVLLVGLLELGLSRRVAAVVPAGSG